MSEGLWIALIAAISGLVGTVAGLFFGKKRNEAETSKVYQDMALQMREDYEKNYKVLQDERKAREDEKRGERLSRDKEVREIKDAAQEQYLEFQTTMAEIRQTTDMVVASLTTGLTQANDKISFLEKEKEQMSRKLKDHGMELVSLKKTVTGQLPPMEGK